MLRATIPPTSPPVLVRPTRRRTATRSKFFIATVSTRLRRSENTSSGAQAARFRKHPNRGQDFARVENRVIATAQQALRAAQEAFHAHRIHTMNLGDSVTGEASEVAKVYAALARQIAQYADPVKPPVALISGGECTVTVRGNGRGGRCTEFLLSLGIELAGTPTSTQSPATRTASTARKTMRVRYFCPNRSCEALVSARRQETAR